MHQAIIKKSYYDGKGTYLQVYIPDVEVNDKLFIHNGLANGSLKIDDDRFITAAQQRLLYSLFNDIRIHEGESSRKIGTEKIKERLKVEFGELYQVKSFSLSNVSQEIASDFLDYVLEYTFIRDIQLTFKLFEVSKVIRNYLSICFKCRTCVICGKIHSHAHHLDTVGSGMDRTKVNHSKKLMMMLCPKHHAEIHNIGDETFCKKYHVTGIFIPIEILKKLNIKGEYGEEANV